MPDMQTELEKIIRSWDQEEKNEVLNLLDSLEQHKTKDTTMFTPTNNVTKATFNFVRDNSGCSRNDAIRMLVVQGHKKSSVSSLIGQMLRQGHIWKDSDGLLRPNGNEYTPIKSSKTIAKREAKVKKPKTSKVRTSATESKGLAALVNEPVAQAFEHRPDIRTSIDVIMDTVSLNDAHELYRRLHLYFGGLGK